MIEADTRKPEDGINILALQVRKFNQHLLGAEARSQQVQHLHHPYAHAAHARTTSAYGRINGNAIEYLGHGFSKIGHVVVSFLPEEVAVDALDGVGALGGNTQFEVDASRSRPSHVIRAS